MSRPWSRKYLYATLPVVLPAICWQFAELLAELNGCSIGFKTMGPCQFSNTKMDISTALWVLRYGGWTLTSIGAFISMTALIYVLISHMEVGFMTVKKWLSQRGN
ncbi:hypothetical protein [Undibacterium sp. Di24W]|uniref:hypothetical protein n=1 Tax=Undibacterium sp. Di24W TaxID=3413033 RepID=UPI003BF0A234